LDMSISTIASEDQFAMSGTLCILPQKQRFERLELSFSTQEVRRICKNLRSANRKLGEACATFLYDRLADIDAAENGSDLNRPYSSKAEGIGCVRLKVL